ncbi:MAG: HXXEE domain-containing protein [Leptotrichia hongkongensis]|nr:HXXEE domain-containing protein [Leptotrichia hongkongensis]
MEIYKLSFIIIVLFMIHEFEEIIFIKKFIKKNKVVKDMKNELFVKKKESYPSTETTSLMIAEEFIILSTLLSIASEFRMYEIVLSLFIVYIAHLVPHIYDALRYRKFSPGSRTSFIIFPLGILIIWNVILNKEINFVIFILCVIIIGFLMILNLIFLHKISKKIDKYLRK